MISRTCRASFFAVALFLTFTTGALAFDGQLCAQSGSPVSAAHWGGHGGGHGGHGNGHGGGHY